MKKYNEHKISDAVMYAVWICHALDNDESIISPSMTLRSEIRIILKKLKKRNLFTWYERLGVYLLTRRVG